MPGCEWSRRRGLEDNVLALGPSFPIPSYPSLSECPQLTGTSPDPSQGPTSHPGVPARLRRTGSHHSPAVWTGQGWQVPFPLRRYPRRLSAHNRSPLFPLPGKITLRGVVPVTICHPVPALARTRTTGARYCRPQAHSHRWVPSPLGTHHNSGRQSWVLVLEYLTHKILSRWRPPCQTRAKNDHSGATEWQNLGPGWDLTPAKRSNGPAISIFSNYAAGQFG